MSTNETPDQALRRLVASEDIRTLHSQYCRRMDSGDFGGVAALFVESGVWETPYTRAAGRAEIESILRSINPEVTDRKVRKHVVADGIISITGAEATSEASYLVLVAGEGQLGIVVAGTYADDLVETDEGWRFVTRRLVHDLAAADLRLRR